MGGNPCLLSLKLWAIFTAEPALTLVPVGIVPVRLKPLPGPDFLNAKVFSWT